MKQEYRELIKRFTVGAVVLSQLFFVASSAFASPALRNEFKPSSEVVPLQGEVSFSHGSDPVTVSLRDTDVRQVLRMLADKAHLNIIFHDSVSGTVTLDLVNAPLVKVFNYIMSVNKLSYWLDDKTIIVASADAAKDLNLNNQEMVALPVKYVDAKIIADFLNKNIFSLNRPGINGSQVAITNPQKNEIIIMGTTNDVTIAQRIIKKFDQKPSVTTFDVKYSSPSEIANALCSIVFGTKGAGGGGDDGGGGGSSSGASSSKSSDNTSFGKAVVACSSSNTVTADKLESIKNNAYSVVYYPDNNQILLFGGTKDQISLAKEYIDKTDIKQLQVLMDVSIVELSETDNKSLQSAWEIHTKRFNFKLNDLSGGGFSPSSEGEFGARPPWPYTQNGGFNYISTDTFRVINYLKFLVSNQKARTLTNPKILATNNKKSEINITRDYVKSVTRQVTAVGVGSTSVPQSTYEIANDAGVKLSLTPTITNAGNVIMDIEPSFATPYQSIYEEIPDGQGGKTENLAATLLTRREMKLKSVMVKDGETLVVGGLLENDESKQVGKVPFLGDIPFIGALFRSSSVDKTKSELVIMLTPHILRDDDEMVNFEETVQKNEDNIEIENIENI